MLPGQVPGRRSHCPCLEACPPPTPMCCGPPAPAVANVNWRKWGHYSGADKQIFLLPQVCHVRSQAIATYHSHSGSVPLDIWYFFALQDTIRIKQNRHSLCKNSIISTLVDAGYIGLTKSWWVLALIVSIGLLVPEDNIRTWRAIYPTESDWKVLRSILDILGWVRNLYDPIEN